MYYRALQIELFEVVALDLGNVERDIVIRRIIHGGGILRPALDLYLTMA